MQCKSKCKRIGRVMMRSRSSFDLLMCEFSHNHHFEALRCVWIRSFSSRSVAFGYMKKARQLMDIVPRAQFLVPRLVEQRAKYLEQSREPTPVIPRLDRGISKSIDPRVLAQYHAIPGFTQGKARPRMTGNNDQLPIAIFK